MLFILILASLCFQSLGFVARPLLPDHRIVGGVTTTIFAHPHQASLQVYGSHVCGASIIGNKWVVTAGHCGSAATSMYTVSIGSTNKYGGVRYNITKVVRHPLYDDSTVDYDIALLEIDGIIMFKPTVKPIKLATEELAGSAMVNVTGWGALSQGGPSSAILMQVSVPIVSRKTCANAYSFVNEVTERMICAGHHEGGRDSCQGDSGGPLTANETLYGIVSWGFGCAQPRYPGVYSNVANFRSWIKDVTGI